MVNHPVVTGMGMVSAAGCGVNTFWSMVMSGPPQNLEPGYLLAPAIDLETAGLSKKKASRIDPFALNAMVAAREAVRSSGVDQLSDEPLSERRAVIMGSTIAGLSSWEKQYQSSFLEERPWSPLTGSKAMVNAAVAEVAMDLGWTGPCESVSGACASSLMSLDAAIRLIRLGRIDVAVAGGSECTSSIGGKAIFASLDSLASVCRPFDRDRSGLVSSEGAAVVVIESAAHAARRGATPLAEILGSASGCDAYHVSAPHPDGAGAERCMRAALRDAGLEPFAVDWVAAHGTATPLNDAAEAKAISRVFGEHMPTTSIKGATGHPWAASGVANLIAAVCGSRDQVIPPTFGFEEPDEDTAKVDVSGSVRPWEGSGPVMCNSFGFGGHNACAVIRTVV